MPEFELFDLGHVAALHRLLDTYGPPYGGQVHCDLVMGVPGGMPGTAAALVAAVPALPAGCSWSATGIGRTILPVALAALSAGGHLRVGMEDTLTFAEGQPGTRQRRAGRPGGRAGQPRPAPADVDRRGPSAPARQGPHSGPDCQSGTGPQHDGEPMSLTTPYPNGRRRIDRVLADDFVADLTGLDLDEVRSRRREAEQEEADLSYIRRMLQGRMDILRAELARRSGGGGEKIVEHLSQVLADSGRSDHGLGRYLRVEPSRVDEHRRSVEQAHRGRRRLRRRGPHRRRAARGARPARGLRARDLRGPAAACRR